MHWLPAFRQSAFGHYLLAALIGCLALAFFQRPAQADSATPPTDPLNSVMWKQMVSRHLSDGPIVFDSRVRVMLPESAEDQFYVPVTIDATELKGVEKIVVLTDLNPIAHVATYRPQKARAFLGLRVKVEQTTPVRAAVKTADGVWHVGGGIVQAAGGGCSAPASAHANKNWIRTLGNTRVVVRRHDKDAVRMTLRMRHPMDTGLAFGYSAFFLNQLNVRNADDEVIASLELAEPISENPTLTIMPRVGADAGALQVAARDTEGNEFGYSVKVPAVTARD